MEALDPEASRGNMRHFTVLVVLAQLLGLAAVAMTAVWMGHYQGGFAWHSDPFHELSYHPLFMVIGMVFLYSDAILAFRVFHTVRKTYVKVLHAVIQLLVLGCVIAGLMAVFDFHSLNKPSIPDMYSLHSWLGFGTVIMFCLQWVIGFMAFLFPKLGAGARKMVLPMHVLFGTAIFCMAIGAALTGITEMAFLTLKPPGYAKKPPVAMLLNSLGLVLVALAMLVVYIVSRPEYRRLPKPDEDTK